MHNAGTVLVVVLLRDPALLEGAERGQNRPANPLAVLALRRRNALDAHGARREAGELARQTVRNSRKHGAAAAEQHVAVEVLAQIDVALHDAVVDDLVNAGALHAEERGLEQRLGAPVSLVANCDHLQHT